MNSLRCSFLWLFLPLDQPRRLVDGINSPLRGFALCVAFGVALMVTAAAAVAYPTKPIRLIVPSAAGGNPDILARLIASELSKQMGQQVVVDNRGGASGIIGFELIAKAVPDGYTFGMATFPIVTNPSAFAKLPYDTAKDFQPVIWQGSNGNF